MKRKCGFVFLVNMFSVFVFANKRIIELTCILNRLHQPVKNPISDNSNILWNSPSLGINFRYRLP